MPSQASTNDVEKIVQHALKNPGLVSLRILHNMHLDKGEKLNLNVVLSNCPQTHLELFSQMIYRCLPEISGNNVLGDNDTECILVATNLLAIALSKYEEGKPGESALEVCEVFHRILPGSIPKPLYLAILRLFQPIFEKQAGDSLKENVRIALLKNVGNLADVQRLYAFHRLIFGADLDLTKFGPNNSLRESLLSCCMNPLFLKNSPGQKFIAFLATLKNLTSGITQALIQVAESSRKKSSVQHIGQILLLMWRNMGNDRFKPTAFNIIDKAIMAVKEPLAGNMRAILGVFHANKQLPNMDALLYSIYTPTLLPNVFVANPFVRRNCIYILCDAYPVHNPNDSRQHVDETINQHLDKIINLLDDNVPWVRMATIHSVSSMLSRYFVIVPMMKSKIILTKLVTELVFDASYVGVRVAVLMGLEKMLVNHDIRPTLSKYLHMVAPAVHDTSERVRISFFSLLLKVKSNAILNIAKIVPINDILLRLKDDSPVVVGLIMQIILESYFPKQSKKKQLIRAHALIDQNAQAARVFYQHIYLYVSPDALVEFAISIASEAITSIDNPQKSKKKKSNNAGASKKSKRRRVQSPADDDDDDRDDEEETGPTTNPVVLLAIAADILQSLDATLSKDTNKKLRKYVESIFVAKDMKPYLTADKYPADFRVQILRIASCLSTNKAKPLFSTVVGEIKNIGADMLSNYDENDGEYTMFLTEYFSALLSCCLNWKEFGKVVEIVDAWILTIENPPSSENTNNTTAIKRKNKNKNTKTATKKKKNTTAADNPERWLAMKSIISLIDCFTTDANLRRQFLKEIKTAIGNASSGDDGRKNGQDANDADVFQLLLSIRLASQACISYALMCDTIIDEARVYSQGSLLGIWRLLVLIVSAQKSHENTRIIVGQHIDECLSWIISDILSIDRSNKNKHQVDFAAEIGGTILTQINDLIMIGSLTDETLQHVEELVEKLAELVVQHPRTKARNGIVSETLFVAANLAEAAYLTDRKDDDDDSTVRKYSKSVAKIGMKLVSCGADDVDAGEEDGDIKMDPNLRHNFLEIFLNSDDASLKRRVEDTFGDEEEEETRNGGLKRILCILCREKKVCEKILSRCISLQVSQQIIGNVITYIATKSYEDAVFDSGNNNNAKEFKHHVELTEYLKEIVTDKYPTIDADAKNAVAEMEARNRQVETRTSVSEIENMEDKVEKMGLNE